MGAMGVRRRGRARHSREKGGEKGVTVAPTPASCMQRWKTQSGNAVSRGLWFAQPPRQPRLQQL